MPTVPGTRKTKATYSNLVASARESVRKTGGLSPEQVADHAGLSSATLYAYFGSKDSLLAAAFDAALADIAAGLLPLASVEKVLEDGWEATARQMVRVVAKGFSHDGRLVRLALTRLDESAEIQTVYSQRNQEVMSTLARFARLGAAAGSIREGNPEVLSKAALVVLQALQNPLAISPGSGPVIDELAGALYHLLAPVKDRAGDRARTRR